MRSLEEGFGGDLKLFLHVIHEPLSVGTRGEIHVAIIDNSDGLGGSLDLLDELSRSGPWADSVVGADDEGHGHLVDLGDINEFAHFV